MKKTHDQRGEPRNVCFFLLFPLRTCEVNEGCRQFTSVLLRHTLGQYENTKTKEKTNQNKTRFYLPTFFFICFSCFSVFLFFFFRFSISAARHGAICNSFDSNECALTSAEVLTSNCCEGTTS